MTRLMTVSYFETKLRWKIGRNFYIQLEIKENEDSEFKETDERSRKSYQDEVKKYIANNYADLKYLRNRVLFNIPG